MLLGFTDETHKAYDNKQAKNGDTALLPWIDVAHNEGGGWDERGNGGDGIVEAPWSGQDWQWSL